VCWVVRWQLLFIVPLYVRVHIQFVMWQRYQDYLNETETSTSVAYILQGGVKAWLEKYANEEELVDKD
jgi:hypothetical protein